MSRFLPTWPTSDRPSTGSRPKLYRVEIVRYGRTSFFGHPHKGPYKYRTREEAEQTIRNLHENEAELRLYPGAVFKVAHVSGYGSAR